MLYNVGFIGFFREDKFFKYEYFVFCSWIKLLIKGFIFKIYNY